MVDYGLQQLSKRFKVGDIVYQSYSPLVPGKVLEIGHSRGSQTMIKVRWLKKGNPETEIGVLNLKLLDQLISDTDKKLKGHKGRKKKALAL